MPKPVDTPTRKTITLPQSLWDQIAELRFDLRIGTEAEAVRRVVAAGIAAIRSAGSGLPEGGL